MKKIELFLPFVFLTLLFNSCIVTYELTSPGEEFNSLTKITDINKPCFGPVGGENNENLFFSVLEDKGYVNVYMKDKVLTQAIIQKTFGNNFNFWPHYSDSVKKIVFQYYDNTNYDIYVVDAFIGKAITQITNTDDNEYNPSWSPDGKKIIFEKGAPPKQYIKASSNKNYGATRYTFIKVKDNQIWIKNLESGELKMIGNGSYPKISPDGKSIAFIKYELNKYRRIEVGTLWIMSIDGETLKQLTSFDLGYTTRPNWSPDNNSIIFELTKKNKIDSDIYIIDIDGENLKQLTLNKSNDFAPYWSKDGYIYFTSDRGNKTGKYQIWRFKISK